MKDLIKIEVCVDSIESALIAEESGAHRLELCSALSEGGLTPSYGFMQQVLSRISIPVNVLIRPRAGDFLYSSSEVEAMKTDIKAAKELGVSGFVIGVLNSDGTINTEVMSELIRMCTPMPVTFSRAFDTVYDQFDALEQVINLGCIRILTSGGKLSAPEGMEQIALLNLTANKRIIIMPGSGISADNIEKVYQVTACNEFHLSASVPALTMMQYHNNVLINSFHNIRRIADKEKVQSVCSIALTMNS